MKYFLVCAYQDPAEVAPSALTPAQLDRVTQNRAAAEQKKKKRLQQ